MSHCPSLSSTLLGRAVRFLAGAAGIRQFLDIGTGLPTVDNTHEVAQRISPDCRIVYVDNDPIGAGACPSAADQRPRRRLRLLGILGNVLDDDEAHAIRDRLIDALPPGSYLALEDGTNIVRPEAAAAAEQTRAEGGDPYRLRSPEQITQFFHGLELLEPGVVSVSRWRSETTPWELPAEVGALCGVARKPVARKPRKHSAG